MDMAALAAAEVAKDKDLNRNQDQIRDGPGRNGNHGEESEVKLDGVGVEMGSEGSGDQDHPPSEDINWEQAVAAQQAGRGADDEATDAADERHDDATTTRVTLR